MACPHVSGAAAYLESVNPKWSVLEIKYALLTTTTTMDNENAQITNDTGSSTTSFDLGTGELNSVKALKPGLVYESDPKDHFLFLCYYGYNQTQINNISGNKSFVCPQDSKPELISNIHSSLHRQYLPEQFSMDKSRLVLLDSPERYVRALTLGPNKGGVAAVVDELPYIHLFLSKHCGFRIVGGEFTKREWGFVFPKNSPFTADMYTTILSLSESGELHRIQDKSLKIDSCETPNSHHREFEGEVPPNGRSPGSRSFP